MISSCQLLPGVNDRRSSHGWIPSPRKRSAIPLDYRSVGTVMREEDVEAPFLHQYAMENYG